MTETFAEEVPWKLAGALYALRSQINGLAPHRDKTSDGTIGDKRHQREPDSDHNPHPYAGQEWVCAFDCTNNAANGMPGEWLARSLQIGRDPRIKYVIWDRHIMAGNNGVFPWEWMAYTGDPHLSHVHISVLLDQSTIGISPLWALPVFTAFINRPTLYPGSVGQPVQVVQTILKIMSDGIYGPLTEKAVRQFQSITGLTVDGIVGPHTWAALKTIL